MVTHGNVRTLRAGCLALSTTLICTTLSCRDTTGEVTPVRAEASLRQLRDGAIVGAIGRNGGHVWRGIPFAAPPTGPRRWRFPHPPVPWRERREALRPPPFCPQIASPFGGVNDVPAGSAAGDEDCLYLDIYAPELAQEDIATGRHRLPVMFWIHGGGNVIGHAGFYDASRLATRENVIVVVTQYRLGPLGWLRHEALRAHARSEGERSGNFATLDLLRSLEWVRDNIATFGGDPSNVTIFGESAGARNVLTLLLIPQARGLFHRAIAQSGATYLPNPASAENFTDDPAPGDAGSSNELLLQLLQNDGRAGDRDTAKGVLAGMSQAAIRDYFYAKSPQELLAGYDTDHSEGLIRLPNNIADGALIPTADAVAALSRPQAHPRVPVMLGTNRDENKIFMFPSSRWVRRWLFVVPRLRDPALYHATASLLADLWKARGADAPAAALRRSGNGEVYVYRWDWDDAPTILGADLSEMVGAAHGLEIPFIFGHFDLGPEAAVLFDEASADSRDRLSRDMMSYWAKFARTGRPGRGTRSDLPQWQPWSENGSDNLMLLDSREDGGPRMVSNTMTRDLAFQRFRNDERLDSAQRRCESLRAAALYDRNVGVETLQRFDCSQ